ncbi:MAG TPA: hypothetical protein VJU86_03625 [Pyrinomonadaceae bacterium]|nr:hypothetical protein [Pyrinomonadaceae bacterium]
MATNNSSELFVPKVVLAVIASLYFLWCAYDPSQWHLIDGVDLVIHEAGHLIFSPFGEFMTIAGGSLFQVIMPALFVGYFLYHGKLYSAAVVLFWVGQSILNVSVYAGDSLALQLPLLGGQDSTHDWNYLLSSLGLLPSTAKIAGGIRLVGTLLIVLSAVGSFKFARQPARE